MTEIGAETGHNKIAINIVWTLIAGFMVMFMQAGFALVETGFTQKKNVAHTMGMNFMVYAVGMIGFWICGFAFMFGGGLNAATLGGAPGVIPHEYIIHMFGKDFGIVGSVGFFLNSKVYDVGVFTLFLFQMVFMDTTATIPTGSMAERWSFKSFLIFGFFLAFAPLSAPVVWSQDQKPDLSDFPKLSAERDWPWWRGPLRNGIASDTPVPTTLSSTDIVKWQPPAPGRAAPSRRAPSRHPPR